MIKKTKKKLREKALNYKDTKNFFKQAAQNRGFNVKEHPNGKVIIKKGKVVFEFKKGFLA